MTQVRVHRFGWYIIVSVLIHLVGASWAFRQLGPIALSPNRDSGIRVRVVPSAAGLASAATAQSALLLVAPQASIAPVQLTPDEPATPLATLDSQAPLPSSATRTRKLPQPSPVRQVSKRLPIRQPPTPRPATTAAAAKRPPHAKRKSHSEPPPPRRQSSEIAQRAALPPPPEAPLTTASLEPLTPGLRGRESADRPSQSESTQTGAQDPLRSAGREASTGSGGPRFVFQPKPKYPMMARRRGWEGTVVLNLEVLADGSIGTVEVVHSSGYPQLDTTAKTTVKRWKHQPEALRVHQWATQEIHFKLD